MLRRNARLRKEYLYRKSLEGKEKELYEKKRKIRQALEGTRDTHMHDTIPFESANATHLDYPLFLYMYILQKENPYLRNYDGKKQS